MTSEKRGWLKGMIGFLFGGLAGFVGGLLVAPKSGRESREQLRAKAEELAESGRETYTAQREKVQDMIEAGRTTASEKSEELRSKIEEIKGKLREEADEVEKAIKKERVEKKVGPKAKS